MATKKRDAKADKQQLAATPRSKRAPGAIQKELPVRLTEKERSDYGDALATSRLQCVRLHDEKSAFNSTQNAAIKTAEEECTRLATALDNGEELRMVDCYWHEEVSKHEKYLERGDTHEEIDRRPMTGEELQNDLGL